MAGALSDVRAVMARAVTLMALAISLGGALTQDGTIEAPPSGDWLPVPAQSLDVAAGSALDFSGLVPASPAGTDGALTLGDDGHLRLGRDTDPRFNCAMIANGPGLSWTLPTHDQADALAVQLRRHGYNLVRFHFMDARLAARAPAGQEVNPESLDRYYYLLAALKRNGIYWMLDILTAPNGLHTNFATSDSANDLKVRVNFDPAARQQWLALMRTVYARTNPYTGTTPLADPALAFVIGANENSIAFSGRLAKGGPYPAGLGQRFDQWLQARYPTRAALSTALGDMTPDEQAGKTPVAPPFAWRAVGRRTTLFRTFVSGLEVDTYRWMGEQLRAQGYRGPVLAYPEWYQGLDNRTRAALPITDLHAYVGEVSSYATGTPLDLPALTSDHGLGAWLTNVGGRWLDRPLVMSEYGSPFPNPYRYDSGLLVPAVSAFQGYTATCRMAAMSVEPEIPGAASGAKPIYPYSVGVDPVARAAETLSTLLFYRRDVAPATGPGIAVPFGEPEMAVANSGFLSSALTRGGLLVKFGLVPRDKVASLPDRTLILPLQPPPEGLWGKATDRLIAAATGSRQQQTEAIVSALIAHGALPKGNRTAVAQGLYQSQTGETTLDQGKGLITVSTPRTEAVSSVGAQTGITLRTLSVASLSDGALVAATTLDGRPLDTSDRILFVLAGGARNSGMTLMGNGSTARLGNWGKLPILIKRIVARISLRRDGPFTGRFSVLALNGTPIAGRKVVAAGGTVPLVLDTAAVPATPTTYFLLQREGT